MVHELEQALLHLERGVAHRWPLKTVAERLVIELDRAVLGTRRAAVAVPVVDERIELAGHRRNGASGDPRSGSRGRAHGHQDRGRSRRVRRCPSHTSAPPPPPLPRTERTTNAPSAATRKATGRPNRATCSPR